MQKKTFSARVNDQEYEFDNLTAGQLDLIPVGDKEVHIIHDNTSYHARIVATDFETKSFRFKINGSFYTVKLADQYDKLVERLGLHTQSALMIKDIKAPMPGMVLEVNVESGQEVAKDDQLLILEAMKMENVIKSPGDGIVKNIPVTKGQPVEKGYVLIEME